VETPWCRENVFLGLGGINPGLDIYDIETGIIEHWWSLPHGESVYALDVSLNGNRLAVGTKNGFLYHACGMETDVDEAEIPTHKITHGFSVLSICFLDSDQIAVSDINGRCLVWSLAETPHFYELPTNGQTICSLFRVDNGHLAGLTMQEKLLVWEWYSGEIVQELAVPPLAKYCALIKPTFWPAAQAWVWPGQQDVVVICDIDAGLVKVNQVHAGEVYAVAICGDHLLTIGKDDSKLRLWCQESTEPVQECNTPKGVIVVTAWMDSEPKVILSDDHGTAALYGLSQDSLCFISGLQGHNIRAIMGPNAECLESARQQKRRQQVQAIAGEIKQRYSDDELEGTEEMHEQIVGLGYEHVSLGLRIKQASDREDLIGELKYSKCLSELTSPGQADAPRFVANYARLLESVWQLAAAHDVYAQLLQHGPSDSLQQRVERLEPYLSAMRAQPYVIESTLPLQILAEAACAVGESMHGQFCIYQYQPMQLGVPGITSSVLIEHYKRICRKNSSLPMPQARELALTWLTETRVERIEILLFDGTGSSPVQELHFALKIYATSLQTVLVPVALFDVNAALADMSRSQQNHQIHRLLDMLESQAVLEGWVHAINKLISLAIGEAVNERRARLLHYPGEINANVPTDNLRFNTSGSSKNVPDRACSTNR